MIQLRRDRHVTFARKALSDVSNMAVHSESFLEDEHPGNGPFSAGRATKAFMDVPSLTASVWFSVDMFVMRRTSEYFLRKTRL